MHNKFQVLTLRLVEMISLTDFPKDLCLAAIFVTGRSHDFDHFDQKRLLIILICFSCAQHIVWPSNGQKC